MLKATHFAPIVLLAIGCTAHVDSQHGFPTYTEMAPKNHQTYAFSNEAPARYSDLLDLALSRWNDATGGHALRRAASYEKADVKINYAMVKELEDSPAHTNLLGCMNGFNKVTDCTIHLDIPEDVSSVETMTKMAYLFKQGDLDGALYARNNYSDVTDYLKDKLMLLELVHEVGHSIGLAHANDKTCVMAAEPNGEGKFCAGEITAARTQLALGPDRS